MKDINEMTEDEINEKMEHDTNTPLTYTLDDVVAAVQYGFEYHRDSQNDGKSVPLGNTLQWLMGHKGRIFVPKEFDEYKKGGKNGH